MNARSVIEALFRSGAALFDTTGRGYLSSSGAVYVPMPSGTIASGIQKFVDVWSRGKNQRELLVRDPGKTFQELIDGYGMVAVFVTPDRVVAISRDGQPLNLSRDAIQWFEDRFDIGFDSDVELYNRINDGPTKKILPAAVAIYGKDEQTYKRPDEKGRKKKKKWTPYGTPEDVEFAQMIRKREQAMPKFSGTTEPSAPVVPTRKTPVHTMRFIKGGGANVHPQAKMYGVESAE